MQHERLFIISTDEITQAFIVNANLVSPCRLQGTVKK